MFDALMQGIVRPDFDFPDRNYVFYSLNVVGETQSQICLNEIF